MNTTLDAAGLLQIAQQIERNAAEFYRRAAQDCPSLPCARALTQLAAWEEQHEKTFADMQEGLAQRAASEQEAQETQQYIEGVLKAVPAGDIFNPLSRTLVTRGRGPGEVLQLAIELEKKSILFYLGLQNLLDEENARTAMEIIRQEMKHVAVLQNELASLRQAQQAPS